MFTKGIAKIGGRRKGTANKLTSTFREAVLLAYGNIGGHEACSRWAADNQTDFYRIAAPHPHRSQELRGSEKRGRESFLMLLSVARGAVA